VKEAQHVDGAHDPHDDVKTHQRVGVMTRVSLEDVARQGGEEGVVLLVTAAEKAAPIPILTAMTAKAPVVIPVGEGKTTKI